MPVSLPHPIDAYVAASNSRDAATLASLFAQDAIVHDEGHEYHGPEGVLAWRARVDQAFTVTIEPLTISHRDGLTVLRATVAGDFPGSPIELDFDFQLTDEQISGLKIHP
ncbi:MAG: nuclear transport factor 2 family protein [Solirubrobacteraceae bacterium]|nr:nuclear transport factor 2 family protein [Solirubrobacteraceae bacterium]